MDFISYQHRIDFENMISTYLWQKVFVPKAFRALCWWHVVQISTLKTVIDFWRQFLVTVVALFYLAPENGSKEIRFSTPISILLCHRLQTTTANPISLKLCLSLSRYSQKPTSCSVKYEKSILTYSLNKLVNYRPFNSNFIYCSSTTTTSLEKRRKEVI